jgi:pimeloyl-ACP methyl ester carboxylesterase
MTHSISPPGSHEPEFCTRDGREIAYTVYGDPSGRPIVFCHGTPGSRLLASLLAPDATRHGIALVSPDRPGIGDSDAGAVDISDWSTDVAVLLDQFDSKQAGVIGFSGGAPFALACHDLSRVRSIALVSGVGPPSIADLGVRPVRGICARTRLSRRYRYQRRPLDRDSIVQKAAIRDTQTSRCWTPRHPLRR